MTRLATFLALVIALLWNAPAWAAPAFTLSRSIGPPTGSVTVNGTGFPARRLVDIYFDTGAVCVAATSSTGKLRCSVKVPANAQPGTHWFTLAVRNTGFALQKSYLVRTDWAQFNGFGSAHTGLNHLENTITAANVGNLSKAWLVQLSASPIGSVVVYDGKIYALSLDNRIHAFNATTGAPVAGFPIEIPPGDFYSGGSAARNSLVIGLGNIYLCSGGGNAKLHAYNAKTGKKVLGFPVNLPGQCDYPVTVVGKRVYLSANNTVRAFDAATGVFINSGGFPIVLPGTAIGAPTVVGNRLAVGVSPNLVQVYDLATGALAGGVSSGSPAPVNGTASFLDGTFVVTTADGTVIAAQDVPPNKALKLVLPEPIAYEPVVAQGKVFVATGGGDNRAYALSGATDPATILWSTPLPGVPVRPPVATNDLVFFATASRLVALRISDGAVMWSSTIASSQGGPPAIANGMVYIRSGATGILASRLNISTAAPRSNQPPRPATLTPDYRLKPVKR
jgi:outer membrane protein assembly factor BamB